VGKSQFPARSLAALNSAKQSLARFGLSFNPSHPEEAMIKWVVGYVGSCGRDGMSCGG
jgi:hypothetical protein